MYTSNNSVAPLERRGLKPLDKRRCWDGHRHPHPRGYALRNFPSSFAAERRRRQQHMVCATQAGCNPPYRYTFLRQRNRAHHWRLSARIKPIRTDNHFNADLHTKLRIARQQQWREASFTASLWAWARHPLNALGHRNHERQGKYRDLQGPTTEVM